MSVPVALVTTGPASTPIDEVRHITNFATGEIGTLLTAALLAQGWEVLLCRGRSASHTPLPHKAEEQIFDTNRDLERLLETLAHTRSREIAAVFHAAALSDYDVAEVCDPNGPVTTNRKIPSHLTELRLVLKSAPKLLPRLRGWFPNAWIVGWKYEMEGSTEDAIAAARRQISQKATDATVLNGAAYGPGFGLLEDENPPLHFATKRKLADSLALRAASSTKAHE